MSPGPVVPPDRRPDGYPADLEATVTLADGRTPFLRPVVPGDAPELARALTAADPETVYQRFFRSPVRLDAATVDRLTTLDYRERMAVAAFDDEGRGVGIARYEPLDEGIAEIAVVVDPAWRRSGLATAMLDVVEGAARRNGVARIMAYHLPSNEAIALLLAGRGYLPQPPEGNVAVAAKDLR